MTQRSKRLFSTNASQRIDGELCAGPARFYLQAKYFDANSATFSRMMASDATRWCTSRPGQKAKK